jgi:putative membrane protein
MKITSNFFVGIIAALHFVIAFAEMFLWTPLKIHKRLERLNLEPEEARKVAPIVANAGLYNAFLASALVWSLLPTVESLSAKFFFLSCVAIAGIYGAITLKWITIAIQTLPALVTMLLLWIAGRPA